MTCLRFSERPVPKNGETIEEVNSWTLPMPMQPDRNVHALVREAAAARADHLSFASFPHSEAPVGASP